MNIVKYILESIVIGICGVALTVALAIGGVILLIGLVIYGVIRLIAWMFERITGVKRIATSAPGSVSFTKKLSRDELRELRDAFSGAVLNPVRDIFRCARCGVHYQEDSYRTIQLENGSRCIACSAIDIQRVEGPAIVFLSDSQGSAHLRCAR